MSVTGWRTYISYNVWLAGLALALTYLTVLGLLVYLVKKEKKKEERLKALEAKLEAVKVETIRAINQ